jgi:hypothetical protein
MPNLTACKTAQEALDKWALDVGFQDCPAKLSFHDSKIVGIDFIKGECITKWRKPKEKND